MKICTLIGETREIRPQSLSGRKCEQICCVNAKSKGVSPNHEPAKQHLLMLNLTLMVYVSFIQSIKTYILTIHF